MKERFSEESKGLYHFFYKVYVCCPICKKCAVICKKGSEKYDYFGDEILTCSYCGYLREGKHIFQNSTDLSLWLKVNCCGEILWGLNYEHLDYLEKYIGAQLRERKKSENGWHNQSIESRIPKWMKDSNNREEVLKSIKKLKSMITKC